MVAKKFSFQKLKYFFTIVWLINFFATRNFSQFLMVEIFFNLIFKLTLLNQSIKLCLIRVTHNTGKTLINLWPSPTGCSMELITNIQMFKKYKKLKINIIT